MSPGVYRFRDPQGRVVYVGKAINLRSRLNSYFQDFSGLHTRTQTMLTTASSVDWLTVGNEVEALVLEYSWIKEYSPRFNVRFRDDKTYPYLAVTVGEEYPRVAVVREAKRKGTRYFGPYTQVWAIKATLEELIRVFPVRSCRNGARHFGGPSVHRGLRVFPACRLKFKRDFLSKKCLLSLPGEAETTRH